MITRKTMISITHTGILNIKNLWIAETMRVETSLMLISDKEAANKVVIVPTIMAPILPLIKFMSFFDNILYFPAIAIGGQYVESGYRKRD